MQYDDDAALQALATELGKEQPYLGLQYGRLRAVRPSTPPLQVPASPPGYIVSGNYRGSLVRISSNVTVRHAAAVAARIVGLRPKAFALSCTYAFPGTPTSMTNCTVRVTGRYGRNIAGPNKNNNNGPPPPDAISGPSAGAVYGPFDFYYDAGNISRSFTKPDPANMTHFTLPPPAGVLTDLQWDILSIYPANANPDFASMGIDNFAYDLISKKR